MKKIVITGAPHSGKTTLINYISNKKFGVVPESAMITIEFLQKFIPNGVSEWRSNNQEAFSQLILQKQIESEKAVDTNNSSFVFHDRGAFDVLAFSKLYDLKNSDSTIKLLDKFNYDIAFVLDLIEPFDPRSDTGRTENVAECIELQKHLASVYFYLGMHAISVPVMPVNERFDFIIDTLYNVF